jgi:hypothetical protein
MMFHEPSQINQERGPGGLTEQNLPPPKFAAWVWRVGGFV